MITQETTIAEDTSVIDVQSYDKILVAFSGGKDSLACLLKLLSLLPVWQWNKIEIHHHLVDGRGASKFMDWAVTSDYCKAVSDHFGLEYYESWREGGFEREILKDNDVSGGYYFDTPEGTRYKSSTAGPNTRLKFPQVTADLRTRWCSGFLKIDLMDILIRNQDRFREQRTLVITGERGEESAGRAKYETFEPHRADLRNGKRYTRHIDHWRPILDWEEKKVWDIIEAHNIVPHPCYYLGWGRCSCAGCIFGNADMFKSLQYYNGEQFNKLADYEERFDFTMKRDISLVELIEKGTLYPTNDGGYWSRIALSSTFDRPIVFLEDEQWELPSGAYGDSGCGAQ